MDISARGQDVEERIFWRFIILSPKVPEVRLRRKISARHALSAMTWFMKANSVWKGKRLISSPGVMRGDRFVTLQVEILDAYFCPPLLSFRSVFHPLEEVPHLGFDLLPGFCLQLLLPDCPVGFCPQFHFVLKPV